MKVGNLPRCDELGCRRFVRRPYPKCAICMGKLYGRLRQERKMAPPKPAAKNKKPRRDRKRQRQLYAWRRQNNICIRCGQEPSREERTECAECGAYSAARKKQLYAERQRKMSPEEIAAERAAKNGKRRSTYHKRQQNGICTRCGKTPPRPLRSTCERCSTYELEWKKEKRRKLTPTERTAS